jgi:hypothetical protein
MVLRSRVNDEDVFYANSQAEILKRMRYWLELIEDHQLDYTIEVTQEDPSPDTGVCAYCDARGVALEGIDPAIDGYRCVDGLACQARVDRLEAR